MWGEKMQLQVELKLIRARRFVTGLIPAILDVAGKRLQS
jgi:hypothetical protein